MTRTGSTLCDVGGRIPWTALRSFVAHLGADSALVKEITPDVAGWQGTDRVPAMLADLIDAVNSMHWSFLAANTRKGRRRPPHPKPYPRPYAKDEGPKVGSDPVPVREFKKWWEGGE